MVVGLGVVALTRSAGGSGITASGSASLASSLDVSDNR